MTAQQMEVTQMEIQADSIAGPGGGIRRARQPDDYKTITINRMELAYVERGSGDAVIFVHGGISDLRIWEKQMASFSESHRAIAYSRRYAWPNSDVPDGVDDQIWPHADDLAELIRKLDAAPAHLVGNSWGAFVCLLTALRYPDLVRTITVEEPPVLPLYISNQPKPQELLKLFLTRPRTATALTRFFATAMGPAIKALKKGDLDGGVRVFARGVLGADVYEGLPADVKEAMRANGKALSSQLLGAGFPAFMENDVRRIETPTLLVTGEKSPALLHRMTDRLQELLPKAQRVDISGASHLMHYEQPVMVNAAVLDFIAGH
jgi:pimeloyl-ACP methyl ester carboxylesterase